MGLRVRKGFREHLCECSREHLPGLILARLTHWIERPIIRSIAMRFLIRIAESVLPWMLPAACRGAIVNCSISVSARVTCAPWRNAAVRAARHP